MWHKSKHSVLGMSWRLAGCTARDCSSTRSEKEIPGKVDRNEKIIPPFLGKILFPQKKIKTKKMLWANLEFNLPKTIYHFILKI